MIITVFGATGQVGKRVVQQALAKGHTVRAFGRNLANLIDIAHSNERLIAFQGYVFDKNNVLDAVLGCDAVISTLGGAFDGTDKTRSIGIKNIVTQLTKAGVKRIVALGGLGVLNNVTGNLVMDAPDYPAEFLPVGREHLEAYLYLKSSGLDWTFVCSPNIVNEDGHQSYLTNIDFPPTPNKFEIAAGDIADCMLKAVFEHQFIQKKLGISKR